MSPAPLRAVHLAEEHFGDNLAIAFVGGSHARRTQKSTSDIDVFVLIRHSDRAAETAFAQALRALHQAEGLTFDHCGEVFDTGTLEGLLAFTEQTLSAVPVIQQAACYQADCPLSVFRKGDVVFKFLHDPKLHTVDPDGLLPGLEKRAGAYFARWPMPRVQEHKADLRLPAGSPQAGLADVWRERASTEQWADTPTGIGLDRWFGTGLLLRSQILNTTPTVTITPHSPNACPLPLTHHTVRRAYAAQCLAPAFPHPEGQK